MLTLPTNKREHIWQSNNNLAKHLKEQIVAEFAQMDMDNVEEDFLELEIITVGGFRVWHIIAICLGILMSIIVIVCCCIRFRIPRTKQEIEADYQRKQITKKFREKLQQIKNSEMDDMDLQKAIARIQADLLSASSSSEHLEKIDSKHNLQALV